MSKCKIHAVSKQALATATIFYSGQTQHNIYQTRLNSSHIFSRCGSNVSAGLDSSTCSVCIPSVSRAAIME